MVSVPYSLFTDMLRLLDGELDERQHSGNAEDCADLEALTSEAHEYVDGAA